MTSAMSARISRRVTAESRARAALTMVPRFTDEHGSSANSEDATRIVSPGGGGTGERERGEKGWKRREGGLEYRFWSFAQNKILSLLLASCVNLGKLLKH